MLDFISYIGEVFQKICNEGIYREGMLGPNNTDKFILAKMCSGIFCKEGVINYSF